MILTIDINPMKLAEELAYNSTRSQDDLISLIKEIDRYVAEFEFTEQLEKYFVSEMKKEREAMEDD